MPTTCSECGETLMGAVNRCWSCGKAIVAAKQTGSKPPIRRSPIPLDQVVNSSGEQVKNLSIKPEVSSSLAQPAVPNYPESQAADAFAYAALAVGIFCAVASLFHWLAFIPAIVGMLCGVWGLSSRRTHFAIAGLVLCSIALTSAAWTTAVKIRADIQQQNTFFEEDLGF